MLLDARSRLHPRSHSCYLLAGNAGIATVLQRRTCSSLRGVHTLRRQRTDACRLVLCTARTAAEQSLGMSEPSSALDWNTVRDDALIWASLNGLMVLTGSTELPAAAIHAPVSLAPVSYPRAPFEAALAAMPAFNTLVDAISQDEEYLINTLSKAGEEDEFTGRLLALFKKTRTLRQQRSSTDVAFSVNRSDYMLDTPSGGLLQVEMNTIASSFGALSSRVSLLHMYLAGRYNGIAPDVEGLPSNAALVGIVDGLAAACEAGAVRGGLVLFVVQPKETNVFDQQWLQFDLWERHGVRTRRVTLAELATAGKVAEDGTLTVDGDIVSVVYFRSGYAPTDYPTEVEWQARELVECSDAVKCPSVSYQLTGTKKIQQELVNPGVVERFIGSKEDAKLLRTFFAGQWGLDDLSHPDTAAVVVDALQQPDKYVLKPQREGGGNNLYGQHLKEKLQEGRGLAAYILMQRILPPVNRSVLMRRGEMSIMESLSELGVYGVFLRKGNNVLKNNVAGHLVRTKAATSDEGGVAAGFAVLDSPYLTS